MLTLRLLGRFEVRLNGAPVRRRTRKSDWLLALLILRHDQAVERAGLAELLWPDNPTSSALALLRRELTALRRALGPEAGRLQAPTPRTLRLELAGADVDLLTFDQAIERADTASLETAVRCYCGPLMEGCEEEWIFQERQAREQAYLQALETLAAQALEQGNPGEAERHLRQAVAADPLRESAQRALLQALAAGGSYAAVVLTYCQFRDLLHRELNLAPDPETQALFEQLRTEARGRAAHGSRLTVHGSGKDSLEHEPALPPAARVSEGNHGNPAAAAGREPPFAPATAITEGENRLVTVLFADMSRYLETTRDLEPEETAELVSRLLQGMVDAVLRFEGRVDRFQGDGVLAVFGVPQAHEEDAERAIRAAMAIRAAAHDLGLEVRVGVNTGTVYTGAVGEAPHQEVTVIGPAVSLAARLQELAEPGEVLVGETTYRPTRRAFTFTPRQVAVKGLPGPIVVYRVAAALAHPEKARGIEGLRAALIGREEELAKLTEAFAGVLQGRGQMVSLIGEAGVGKSRLVAELKSGVQVFGHSGVQEGPPELLDNLVTDRLAPLWLEGCCVELGMTASYGPFLDLLRRYFGWQPDDSEATRAGRIVASLRELVRQGDLAEARLDEIGPLMGLLLSVQFGNQWDERLQTATPEQIRQRTFLALRDFFLALCQRQPLILVLEDLHWADPLSLDLIAFLMETVNTAPLLLLCVYRPEPQSTRFAGTRCWHLGKTAARKCAGQYTELHLQPLLPPQSRILVESLLRIEGLPSSVEAVILSRAGGNPFFLEEVVRALIDAGIIYRDADVWRAREGIEAVSVPESIQSVLLSRVDRLEPELKQVLQSAAVIGRLFPVRLLEGVFGVRCSVFGIGEEPADHRTPNTEHRVLEQALWALEERALVYQEQVIPERVYSFQHVLTQATIYQSLLRRQRAVLHQRVAEAMEVLYADSLEPHYEVLAHHYERSGAAEKAVEYLYLAGEKAKRSSANETAIAHYQKALGLLEQGPDSPEKVEQELRLQVGLGPALVAAQGYAAPEVAGVYRRARELCRQIGPTPQLAPVIWGLCVFHYTRAEYETARELAEELQRLANRQADPTLQLMASTGLAICLYARGEFAPALEQAERGLALYDPEHHRSLAFLYSQDFGIVCQCYSAFSLWSLGYPDRAAARRREMLTLAGELPHPFSQGYALWGAALLSVLRREAPNVPDLAAKMIALASQHGFPLWAGVGSLYQGWSTVQQGEGAAGLAQMTQGAEAVQAMGLAVLQTITCFELADACGRAGQAEAGLAAVTEGLALVEKIGERSCEAELYRQRGELLLAVSTQNEGEAEQCFQQALAVARQQQARSWELRAATSRARLWQRQGQRDRARELLGPVYGWFTEGFDTADLQEARALLQELA